MDSTLKLPPDAGTSPGFDKIVDDIAALRRDFAALTSQLKNNAVQGASDVAEHAVDEIGERRRGGSTEISRIKASAPRKRSAGRSRSSR